jgi:transposase
MAEQPSLLAIEAADAAVDAEVRERRSSKSLNAHPKLESVDRSQGIFQTIYVDELIGPYHPARAIWDLTGQLELSRFRGKVASTEGSVGRPAKDPRLLIAIWIYAYSEQISSARELERMMEYEPGLRWLTGMSVVNHHTLSNFRVEHREQLDEMFTELLAILEKQGLIELNEVMHDGTKIRAHAGADAARREKTLNEHLERARRQVAALADPNDETVSKRRQAAQERAARQRVERLEQAAEELKTLQSAKKDSKEKQAVRVNLTEPESRVMKHGDHAYAPSYNAQISTEASNKIIVGMELTNVGHDADALAPAMEKVKESCQRYPDRVVADGGYTNQATMIKMEGKKIEFIGSIRDKASAQAGSAVAAGIDPQFAASFFRVVEEGKLLTCPAGKPLNYMRQSKKGESLYHQYQASASDCGVCEFGKQCCPKNAQNGRTVSVLVKEPEAVKRFRDKMATEQAKAIYKRRGPVAEFPHCWIKERIGLRKFRLRGLVKAGTELLWAVLTYNFMQWIRLSSAKAPLAA